MSLHERNPDLPEDDVRIRIQALVDNELPEAEIEPVLEAIEGSYEYRAEYAELLKLRRKLGSGPAPPVSGEWLERAERRVARRISRGVGLGLFLGSYVVLLGYALYTMLREPKVPVIISVLTLGVVAGFVVLLANAIADRVRERKTDTYRRIIR